MKLQRSIFVYLSLSISLCLLCCISSYGQSSKTKSDIKSSAITKQKETIKPQTLKLKAVNYTTPKGYVPIKAPTAKKINFNAEATTLKTAKTLRSPAKRSMTKQGVEQDIKAIKYKLEILNKDTDANKIRIERLEKQLNVKSESLKAFK